MNPIAKLHFRRQRLYDEMCEVKESCNEMEDTMREGNNEGDDEGDDEEEKEEEEARVSNSGIITNNIHSYY